MSILLIYGDESGGIPTHDDDLPFCVASLGVVGDHPSLRSPIDRRGLLVEQIVKHRAIPFVAFINPSTGYGDVLSKKM